MEMQDNSRCTVIEQQNNWYALPLSNAEVKERVELYLYSPSGP
jgi:hypothetical protein